MNILKICRQTVILLAVFAVVSSAAVIPDITKAEASESTVTNGPAVSAAPYATNGPGPSVYPQTAPTDMPVPTLQPDSQTQGDVIGNDAVYETLPEVNITDIAIVTKTSVKITWDKVSEADGYYIYRIQDMGELMKIKKLKGRAVTTFTDRGLTYGKTYRYAVRAYKKYNGKIYIGNYDKEGYAKKLKVRSVYKKGYKYYYDMDGNRINDVLPFTGKKKSYLIKVNIEKNVTTVYAKDGKKGYTIPVKAFLCSGNKHDTLGTYSLGIRYRYRTLFHNTYGQWTIRIHDSILFHTVVYKRSRDPNSLDVKEYNKLGTSASHGCIRLQCSAAKWIYDNCKAGTKVIFYKSSNPGPLGKPKFEKLPKWHTWDPTDPNMQYKCAEKKCNHRL